MPRVPLIVWSGGMDSTANIIHHFGNKIPFETCFVKLDNNIRQQKSELAARKRILKRLTKLYDGNYHIKDHVIEPFGEVTGRQNYKLIQAKLWIDGVLMGMDISKYNEIIFGYICDDQFWHIAHDVKKLYKISCKLMDCNTFPKLSYPFEWHRKDMLYRDFYKFDDRVREIFDMIWTCEAPKRIGVACNECSKCMEQKDMLNRIQQDNN